MAFKRLSQPERVELIETSILLTTTPIINDIESALLFNRMESSIDASPLAYNADPLNALLPVKLEFEIFTILLL